MRYFVTQFLEEADKFVAKLDKKSASKVFYNIDIAEQTNDPKLFKKLKGEIWEFRSKYFGKQYRLLAFWDKTEPTETLVMATHGFIKKATKFLRRKLTKQNVSGRNILTLRRKVSYGKERNEILFAF